MVVVVVGGRRLAPPSHEPGCQADAAAPPICSCSAPMSEPRSASGPASNSRCRRAAPPAGRPAAPPPWRSTAQHPRPPGPGTAASRTAAGQGWSGDERARRRCSKTAAAKRRRRQQLSHGHQATLIACCKHSGPAGGPVEVREGSQQSWSRVPAASSRSITHPALFRLAAGLSRKGASALPGSPCKDPKTLPQAHFETRLRSGREDRRCRRPTAALS